MVFSVMFIETFIIVLKPCGGWMVQLAGCRFGVQDTRVHFITGGELSFIHDELRQNHSHSARLCGHKGA